MQFLLNMQFLPKPRILLKPFATVPIKYELEVLLQRPIDMVRLNQRMNPALRAVILQKGITA
jgi:uncharacterized protein